MTSTSLNVTEIHEGDVLVFKSYSGRGGGFCPTDDCGGCGGNINPSIWVTDDTVVIVLEVQIDVHEVKIMLPIGRFVYCNEKNLGKLP